GVPAGVDVPIGARVVVSIGKRSVTGIVVDRSEVPPAGVETAKIKPIGKVLDAEAFLPADVVALARWTAEYYAAGVGETITAVLPPKTRGERADAHKTRRVATITAAGLERPETLTPKQLAALDVIAGSAIGVSTAELAARQVGADTLARLVRHGLVAVRHER